MKWWPATWPRRVVASIGMLAALTLAAIPAAGQAPSLETVPDMSSSGAGPQAEDGSGPSPEQQRPSQWGEPTEVRVGIYVIDVDGVDSANQRFSASVYLHANWRIPFLRHDGPAPLIRTMTSVWTPRLALVNEQQASSAFPPYVEISPDGEVTYRQKIWG